MNIERKSEPHRWPEVSEAELSELEIVEDRNLYIALLKPKRLSKPTRQLYQNTPVSEELLNRFGEFKYQYTVDLESYGKAGGHYHDVKVEIFCPHDPIILLLENVDTGNRGYLNIDRGSDDTFFEFIIPTKVAHLVYNPSKDVATYTVLSNLSEKEAIKRGDVKEFKFDSNLDLLGE